MRNIQLALLDWHSVSYFSSCSFSMPSLEPGTQTALTPPSATFESAGRSFRDQQIAFGKRMLVLGTDSQIPRTSSEHGGAHGAVCYRAATICAATHAAGAQQQSPQATCAAG